MELLNCGWRAKFSCVYIILQMLDTTIYTCLRPLLCFLPSLDKGIKLDSDKKCAIHVLGKCFVNNLRMRLCIKTKENTTLYSEVQPIPLMGSTWKHLMLKKPPVSKDYRECNIASLILRLERPTTQRSSDASLSSCARANKGVCSSHLSRIFLNSFSMLTMKCIFERKRKQLKNLR